jgi:alpha-beta hydrolase superfamily lysophospholipase
MIPIPSRWRRRSKTTWLLIAGGAVVIWLGCSLLVAHQLTRRPRALFAEPAPVVAWGTLEPHRLETGDGQSIGAWFAPGPDDDAPSVLVLHGNGGSRRNSLTLAEMYASAGCSVLMISLRAHGDSSGELNDIGYGARHDVVAVVEFLERRRPGKPVVVHGQSLGAAAAVFAGGALGDRVDGYVLECPFRDLKTAVRNRTRLALPPPLDAVAYAGMIAVAPVVLPHVDAIAPARAVREIPEYVPVLILAGESDAKATPAEARELWEGVRSHARLSVYGGAGHVKLRQADPKRYRAEAVGFAKAAGVTAR